MLDEYVEPASDVSAVTIEMRWGSERKVIKSLWSSGVSVIWPSEHEKEHMLIDFLAQTIDNASTSGERD